MYSDRVGNTNREAVLALPLDRLLVKMVRVPESVDAVEFCTPILQEINPFPDEPLTVGCEVVRETESGTIVIAAALPESSTDDIAEALDAEKINVVRIDALAFGELRAVWNELSISDTRKLVLSSCGGSVTIIALDADQPVSVRAVTARGDLTREVMLSLLEAEDFGGVRALEEIVVVGNIQFDSALAPVRRIGGVSIETALEGIKARSEEAKSLDVLPSSWREVLEETRFKSKLVRRLSVAGGLWLLAMVILLGVPFVYGYLTESQKDLSRRHRKQYTAVSQMREKVKLVKKYSDHTCGALEIMKALSDRLPEGIELSSWHFERNDSENSDGGVTVSGEADSADLVYDFKDAMSEIMLGEERLFETVNLRGPTAGKGGKQRFDLECKFMAEEK